MSASAPPSSAPAPAPAPAPAAPPAPAHQASTGLMRVPLPLVPENLDQMWRIAEAFGKADCVPSALKGRVSDILVVLMNGQELGLSPAASLRNIYVIEGTPVLSANLMIAILTFRLGTGLELWEVVTRDDKQCVIQARRKGRKTLTVEWTMERAVMAGLTLKKGVGGGPNMYVKYPRNMFYARAASEMCRLIAPDLFAGFIIPEEEDEILANARQVNEPPSSPAPHGKVVEITSLQQPAPPVVVPAPTAQEEATVRGPQEGASVAAEKPAASGASFPPDEIVEVRLRELEDLMKDGHPPSGEALTKIHGSIAALGEGASKKSLEVRYSALRTSVMKARAP